MIVRSDGKNALDRKDSRRLEDFVQQAADEIKLRRLTAEEVATRATTALAIKVTSFNVRSACKAMNIALHDHRGGSSKVVSVADVRLLAKLFEKMMADVGMEASAPLREMIARLEAASE